MATVSVYSTQITNRNASPRVINNSRISKGAMQVTCGVAEAAIGDNIGSKYFMCSVPSNARIAQVLLSCDDVGSTGTADIGLYQTTANGSAVVDADFFASAQALTTAVANLDVTFEALGANASIDKADMEKPLWEAIGLAADPKIDYDVVLTATEAMELAGTIALQVVYVI